MNKIYRSIWNTTTNTWTAAAETAKSRSKGSARAARSALAALVLGGAAMGGASAAEVCTTEDGKHGTLDVAGVCKADAGATGTMGSVGTMAALDDARIKIGNAAVTGNATATGTNDIAIGPRATADSASAIGHTPGDYSLALGGDARAIGSGNVPIGGGAVASNGDNKFQLMGTAIGGLATVTATNSVALGYSSAANRDNTVSIGNATTQRQIVNMAAGTQATDAVNVSQLKSSVEALGGDATMNADGTIKGPSYTVAGGTQPPWVVR